MVLIIVAFLLATWGVASGYSFYSLQQATQLLNRNEGQQQHYANLVGGLEQSLYAVAALEKAASQVQDDHLAPVKQALAQIQPTIANATSALTEFKRDQAATAALFTEMHAHHDNSRNALIAACC